MKMPHDTNPGSRISGLFRISSFGFRIFTLALGSCLLPAPALAYPPAPHHIIYGSVRNEMGDPIVVTNAEVILETMTGVQLKTQVIPNLAPGINYRLLVPMDAGLTADAYRPTALRPTVPFRLKVLIGQVTYIPIQMSGSYTNLGQPAQSTRLDLTLGEDSDGDGLPDAWERMLIAALGGGLSLKDIRPEDDADGDGLSNLQEYLAGTYAFDPSDGFELSIAGFNGSHALLDFMAIRGHTYTLLASADLQTWIPIPFHIPEDASTAPGHDCYQATDVRILRVEALPPEGLPAARLFFKAQVQ
jgi:hypothetical protein